MSEIEPYQKWLRLLLAPAIAYLDWQAKIIRNLGDGEYGDLHPWLPSKGQKSAPDDTVPTEFCGLVGASSACAHTR